MRVARLVRLTVLSLVAIVALAPAALASSGPNRIVFERNGGTSTPCSSVTTR